MDTGSYMENQMSDLIDNGVRMKDAFDEWLYEAVVIYCHGSLKRDPHEVYPYIKLSDAKLCFLDNMSSLDYSKEINRF